MGSSATLDVLPPELQHGILEMVSDVKTLHALIQASPRFFQVYKRTKVAVMSKITHNHMDPSYRQIAFDVYFLRETKLDMTAYKLGAAYLHDSGNKSLLSGPCSFPLKTSKALMSYHETVEYFISDFAQTRFDIIKRCLDFSDTQKSSHGSAMEPESLPVLSRIEHSRLARAFYHFELFSCLFSMKKTPGDATTGKLALGIYLAHMTVWEVEEFFCVWFYFREKRMDYVDQIQSDILQDRMEEGRSGAGNASQKHFSTTGDMHYVKLNSNFKRVMYLDSSLVLGLITIKEILDEEALQRRSISIKGSLDLGIPWILEMNSLASNRSSRLPSTMSVDLDFKDDIDQPSAGLKWGAKYLEHPNYSADETAEIIRSGLRQWGYAIWDHQRLEKLGTLSQDAVHVSKLSSKDLKTNFRPRVKETMGSATSCAGRGQPTNHQ